VRFEDGSQPLDLLDERLHRLEFLATELSLLHLSYPVSFLPFTYRVDDQPSTQKDHQVKRQGKPPRLREQGAPNPSYRLALLMHHIPSSAYCRDISPRFEDLPQTPEFLSNRQERLPLRLVERALLGLPRLRTSRRLLYLCADGVTYSRFVVCETRA
jgi:hypothetical protein